MYIHNVQRPHILEECIKGYISKDVFFLEDTGSSKGAYMINDRSRENV